MQLIIDIFLSIISGYFLLGFLFAIFFLLRPSKIDPYMANTKKGVRFLLFPGVLATWPILLGKLLKS